MTELSNIASIQAGINAKAEFPAEIIYLQARDFDEIGNVTSDLFPHLRHSDRVERHLLKDGDILFAAKGTKNFAAAFESGIGNSVASSTFLVIRIEAKFKAKILPEYLRWFINAPETQMTLKGKAKGTSVPVITKAALQKLDVHIPTVGHQRMILEVERLWKLETNIQNQIIEFRQKLIQHVLTQSLKRKL